MPRRSVAFLVEEIGSLSMMADADDLETLARLKELLLELEKTTTGKAKAGLHGIAKDCGSIVQGLLEGTARDPVAAFEALTQGTLRLHREASGEAQSAPPASQAADEAAEERFEPPPWVDEAVLNDFFSAERDALDEIESELLAIERGDEAAEDSLKRRIHTLKGEAGVLGLIDLEKVCHAVEDLLGAKAPRTVKIDALLKVRDWISIATNAYASRKLPPTRWQSVVAMLAATQMVREVEEQQAPAAQQTPAAPATMPTALPPTSATPAKTTPQPVKEPVASQGSRPVSSPGKATRDTETVALIGEFLGESEEGLSRTDEVLLNVEKEGCNPESVNGIFRVFHTIKGVAGFLEFNEVQELAHTTETMLNQVREGARVLVGPVLDLTFDATETMRKMMEEIRAAVGDEREAAREPGLAELLRRIRCIIAGEELPETPLPTAFAGERMGEILVREPLSILPGAIVAAIEAQAESGRKLGEELIAQGGAEPKQVAQALRAQSRADDAALGAKSGAKIKETVKIDIERVDALVAMIGELVIVEAMVVHVPEISALVSPKIRNYLSQLEKITRDLQDVGMRMRMVPVRGAFQKMTRMARDLSHKSGKQVRIEVSGENTEMDRSMVEQIADPLVHMIRNALDHGIESRDAREKAGKDPTGTVRLSAYHEGGSIVIEIADDGKGLDRDGIIKKAKSQGLISNVEALSESEIYNLIFAPGFSTAEKVTEISGRGVGMDVVRKNIDAMRGRVAISTQRGEGTTFKIILPLTLAIIDGMLVACGKERYIIPTLSIVESMQVEHSMVVTFAEAGELINVRGEVLPLVRLDRLFNVADAKQDPTAGLIVLVEGVGHKLGLLVDDVVTQQQVVIKSLGAEFGKTEFISGAAIMSDGRVGLIINIEEIGALIGERNMTLRRGSSLRNEAPAAEC